MSEKNKYECSCSELHISMHELLDNELSAAECRRLREHLEHCPHCAERVACETQLRELLQKSCCCVAPETLRAKISYSIRVTRRSS